MDLILNRYRNLTALVAAILVQLVLLAYQVKSNTEVRLIRVWAVTAVTPLARLLEGGRSGSVNFLKDYFVLLDVREQNKRLQTDLNRVQLENQVLRSELDTAERGKALSVFQEQSGMKTVAARIIRRHGVSFSSLLANATLPKKGVRVFGGSRNVRPFGCSAVRQFLGQPDCRTAERFSVDCHLSARPRNVGQA